MPIEVNGKMLETDEEGYLADLNQWEPAAATVMAAAEDQELTDAHWEVINFLREYYEEYQIAPAVRVLTKAIGKKLGQGQGQQQVPVRTVPLRSRQAGL
jgi:dissimilatory sulfite reductase related protein